MACCMIDFNEPNYDPDKIVPYSLENPLCFADGTPLESPEQWPARRREILDIFANEMFGEEPPAPECVSLELVEEQCDALGGFAVRSQYRMRFKKDGGGPVIDWLVLRPNFLKKKARPIIFLNYKGNHQLIPDPEVVIPEGMWSRCMPGHKVPAERGVMCDPGEATVLPVGMLLSAGFAVVSCCYCQISPDPVEDEPEKCFRQDPFAYTGIFDLWGKRDEQRDNNITALGAWAWVLSRGLELAEKIPELDAEHNIVTGCSRLGKAALLATARDERFKICVPIQCGGGGVTLAKRHFGENVATEMRKFTHWYCKAYKKYASNPAKLLTFDQHLLLAAIAPRRVLVAGFDNKWFDTEGEFLSCQAAGPVWDFLGKSGFPETPYPDDFSTAAIGSHIGYYRRTGTHGIAAFDWLQLMKFAEENI